MSTFYVRQRGSDANNGTSAATAWRTIAKAITAVTAGDTVWIGAGIYRETLICTLTFASDVNFAGDVDGAHTGDSGEVRLSAFTSGPAIPSSQVALVQVRGKSHYHWSNIVFVGESGSSSVIDAITTIVGGTYWTFDNCAIICLNPSGAGASCLNFTGVIDTAHHWQFNNCTLVSYANAVKINLPTTASGSDYDADMQFNNCCVLDFGTTIFNVAGTGANVNKGGGVKVQQCSLHGGSTNAFVTNGAGLLSTTFPCTVYDSFIMGAGSALVAATAGQLIEDANLIISNTARANVAIGTRSFGINGVALEALSSYGQERVWGEVPPRVPFTPTEDSAVLGWGTVASPSPLTTDLVGWVRPSGASRLVTSGTATAGGATSLSDGNNVFPINGLVGMVVRITGGTGAGQVKTVKSNTGTVISTYGNWNTNPSADSTYVVYAGPLSDSGKSTNVSNTTALTMSSASWVANMWMGWTVKITAGTSSVGTTVQVLSNTANVLTLSGALNVDTTSEFQLYRGAGINASPYAAGCSERGDTARKETVLTDSGGTAWRIYGWGSMDVEVPVDAFPTTITVQCSFDAAHGNTNKPQIAVLADGETGVAGATTTATGTAGSGTFETLTVGPFTPATSGVVIVRLASRADVPFGKTVFDTITVG